MSWLSYLKHFLSRSLFCLILAMLPTTGFADRIKDLAAIAGVRSNQLVGYGLVVGLSGTGDKSLGITLQSMQSMVSRFGMVTDTSGLSGDNSAAVMVTAELPAFTKPGQTLDVTVSTLGPAESLRGGTLLMTPLLGADGETYAIAQGNMVVGGLGVSGDDGSSLTVNVPTVGRVPQGAMVERMVASPFMTGDYLVFNLHRGDFSTAANVAEAINKIFGNDVAVPLDASSIRVRAPGDLSQRVSFASLVEEVVVEPSTPPAQVIVNSRTGTIIIGGNVRVTPAAITHGSLTVRVRENPTQTAQNKTTTDGAEGDNRTSRSFASSRFRYRSGTGATARAFVFDPGTELSNIVDAINAVGAAPSDLVAILEALKVSGALRAELIII